VGIAHVARSPVRTTPPTLVLVAAVAAVGASSSLAAYRLSLVAAVVVAFAAAVAIVIVARPAVGVLLAIAAVPLEVLDLRFGGSFGLTPTEGLLLFTGGLATLRALTIERLRFSPLHGTFAALVVVSSLGLVFATNTFTVAKISTMWAATLAVSLMVAGWDSRSLRRLLSCIAVTGGVLGVLAFVHSGSQEFTNGGATVTGRAQGAFEHPNLLAFFLVLSVPVAIALAFQSRRVERLVMACAAIAGIEGLVLTLTRGAILGFIVALALLATWRPVRRVLVAGVLLGIVALAAAPVSWTQSGQLGVLTERLASVGDLTQTSTNPRIHIWRMSLGIVAAHPVLGVGAGNFSAAALSNDLRNEDYGRFWEGYDHAHDLLLTIAAELGIAGLGLMLALVAVAARTTMRALRRATSERPLVLAVAAGLTGLFAAGLTDYPLRANAILGTVMIELGALVAFQRMTQRARVAHDPESRLLVQALRAPSDPRLRAPNAQP
jgi:O-antigen ligase